MSDPVEEFEAALAKYSADKSRSDWLSNGAELGMASAMLKYGPALLARLRAAEAAAPKWRKATDADRNDASYGRQFWRASRYKGQGRTGRWESKLSDWVPPDCDEWEHLITDPPEDPPEAQP